VSEETNPRSLTVEEMQAWTSRPLERSTLSSDRSSMT
jgi:hypothetical protein